MKNDQRVLVTGATGLVGNNVVRLLLERGSRVRTLTRVRSDIRPLQGLDVEQCEGDVRNEASVRSAMQGMTHVIHSAAHVHIGWSSRELHQAVNVEGTRNVAEAARLAGTRMIHVSSVDALGLDPHGGNADEEI